MPPRQEFTAFKRESDNLKHLVAELSFDLHRLKKHRRRISISFLPLFRWMPTVRNDTFVTQDSSGFRCHSYAVDASIIHDHHRQPRLLWDGLSQEQH